MKNIDAIAGWKMGDIDDKVRIMRENMVSGEIKQVLKTINRYLKDGGFFGDMFYENIKKELEEELNSRTVEKDIEILKRRVGAVADAIIGAIAYEYLNKITPNKEYELAILREITQKKEEFGRLESDVFSYDAVKLKLRDYWELVNAIQFMFGFYPNMLMEMSGDKDMLIPDVWVSGIDKLMMGITDEGEEYEYLMRKFEIGGYGWNIAGELQKTIDDEIPKLQVIINYASVTVGNRKIVIKPNHTKEFDLSHLFKVVEPVIDNDNIMSDGLEPLAVGFSKLKDSLLRLVDMNRTVSQMADEGFVWVDIQNPNRGNADCCKYQFIAGYREDEDGIYVMSYDWREGIVKMSVLKKGEDNKVFNYSIGEKQYCIYALIKKFGSNIVIENYEDTTVGLVREQKRGLGLEIAPYHADPDIARMDKRLRNRTYSHNINSNTPLIFDMENDTLTINGVAITKGSSEKVDEEEMEI